MRIAETTYRNCCDLTDLRSAGGRVLESYRSGQRFPAKMFCMHCKAEHEYYTYTDAAGSRDWNYRKVKKAPKKKAKK